MEYRGIVLTMFIHAYMFYRKQAFEKENDKLPWVYHAVFAG